MSKKKCKTEVLRVRLSKKEKKKARGIAKIYGFASLSEWVRHCIDNYQPTFKTEEARSKVIRA